MAQAITVDSATEFFENYQTLSKRFDPAVAELFAEDGKLLSTRLGRDGTRQELSMPFANIKPMLPKLMNAAKASGDVSEYSNVQVELLDEEKAKITATRFSGLNCFSDDSYYMVVRDDAGDIEIVEEYSVTLEQGRCETNKALIGTLAATAEAYNAQLPAMIDQDTELTSVTAQETNLAYNYKFVSLAYDEMVDDLAGALRDGVVESSCSMATSKTLLERGAQLVFNYTSSDDVLAATLNVSQIDCE
jgi:hypothetical protein